MKFIENRLYRATIKGCCHSDSIERETKLIYKREVECEVGSYYVSSYLFEKYDGTAEIISEVDGKFFYLVGCQVKLVDIAKEKESDRKWARKVINIVKEK